MIAKKSFTKLQKARIVLCILWFFEVFGLLYASSPSVKDKTLLKAHVACFPLMLLLEGINLIVFYFKRCDLCGVGKLNHDEFPRHLRACSRVFRSTLNDLPKSPREITCPKCQKHLRLWPTCLKPRKFVCDLEECPAMRQRLMNNGLNFYRCFPCDIKACSMCISSMASRVQVSSSPENDDGLPSYETAVAMMTHEEASYLA